jgi:hypothetical protein
MHSLLSPFALIPLLLSQATDRKWSTLEIIMWYLCIMYHKAVLKYTFFYHKWKHEQDWVVKRKTKNIFPFRSFMSEFNHHQKILTSLASKPQYLNIYLLFFIRVRESGGRRKIFFKVISWALKRSSWCTNKPKYSKLKNK